MSIRMTKNNNTILDVSSVFVIFRLFKVELIGHNYKMLIHKDMKKKKKKKKKKKNRIY